MLEPCALFEYCGIFLFAFSPFSSLLSVFVLVFVKQFHTFVNIKAAGHGIMFCKQVKILVVPLQPAEVVAAHVLCDFAELHSVDVNKQELVFAVNLFV